MAETARRTVLRKTVGGWSAGTEVAVLERRRDGTAMVSPWCSPEVLHVEQDMLVARRSRGDDGEKS